MLARSKFLAAASLVGLLATVMGHAGADAAADRSKNIKEIARADIAIPGGETADGSDMAFEGDLLIAGSYSGTAIYRILDGKPYVKQIGFHNCPGAQGDVSVYKNLVFVSLDSAQSEDALGCLDAKDSAGKEGLRILDISDPTAPEQVGFVETDCGSHTHTILPQGDKVFAYIQSYPLSVPSASCSAVSHRKVSIVEVPIHKPSKAKVVNTLDVSPEIGCHDVTILTKRHLAAAACIGETQLWDVKDPAAPVIISRIFNPSIEIHHGTGFTWDGKHLAIADEFAGSITGACAGNQNSPVGALWFYDISDPTTPLPEGYFNIPRYVPPQSSQEVSYLACTSHNFNILPTKDDDSYLAAIGYRNAGLAVVDFSDPAAPKEAAHFLQLEGDEIPDVWAAYWYNGRIYANDNGAGRGISVYEMKGTSRKEIRYFSRRLNPQVQDATFR